ncbi:MAG: hypothetical protein DMF61_02540 [Blastocatellia bacterium AA13]|nr:MAG: hypothetical protein DMF61_02540 [Blastocatellia bacterium AA13]
MRAVLNDRGEPARLAERSRNRCGVDDIRQELVNRIRRLLACGDYRIDSVILAHALLSRLRPLRSPAALRKPIQPEGPNGISSPTSKPE